MAGYTLITPATSEPLSLQEAKVHLRVGSSDGTGSHPDDVLIASLIAGVRALGEQETQRSFITQTWRYTLDAFPGGQGVSATPWGREFSIPETAICLVKGPIQAITAINYVDLSGATQLAPSTDYVADLSGPMARITPVFGKIWPIPVPQVGSVWVTFTAGYGGASAVPDGIKSWMKLRIGDAYDNRGAMVSNAMLPNPFLDSFLNPYRVMVP